jgi:hypothetical protein
MSTKLLIKDIWQRITALAKRRRGAVAVAYCGTGARKRLPLKSGSLLVVNASEQTVRSGLTNPTELLWFFDRDVSIYSVQNLHAKVFVFGDTAIVGSTNVSNHSAAILQEAAITSRNGSVVAQCRRFINDQAREPLERAHLKRLEKIYRPPKNLDIELRGSKASRQNDSPYSPLWLVPLWEEDWDEVDCAQAARARPQVRKKIQAREKLDEFQWPGRWSSQGLSKGDQIVAVTEEGPGIYYVSPASHVVHIKRYTKGAKRTSNMVVFLGAPRTQRRIELTRARNKLGRYSKTMRGLNRKGEPVLVRDPETVRAILGLWPAKAPR